MPVIQDTLMMMAMMMCGRTW